MKTSKTPSKTSIPAAKTSTKPVPAKVADADLDLDALDDDEDLDEDDADGGDDTGAPMPSPSATDAPPPAAEEEEEDADDGDDDADDDVMDVSADDVETYDDMGADDADDDGAEEEEEDADDDAVDVSPDDVQPMSADDLSDDGGDVSDGADVDGAEEEEDADDTIPDVSPDDVQPMSADDLDGDDDGAMDEDDADEQLDDGAAADMPPAAAADGEEGEEEEEEEDADSVEAPAPDTSMPPELQASAMVIEPIYDPKLDMKTADLSMAIFNTTAENPHWVLFNHGDPVAKIELSAQENPEDARESFISEAYGEGLLENIRELAAAKTPVSPLQVLATIKAKFYHSAIRKNELAKQIEAETREAVTSKIARANDSYNDTFLSNMELTVAKQAKNLYAEPEPFKVGLIGAIKKAGVEETAAIKIVEDAFLADVPAWFDRVVAKAKEYCAKTPETLQEIRAELGLSGQRQVDYSEADVTAERSTVAAVANRRPSAGIPLPTYATTTTEARTASAGPGADYAKRVRSNLQGIRARR